MASIEKIKVGVDCSEVYASFKLGIANTIIKELLRGCVTMDENEIVRTTIDMTNKLVDGLK